VRVKGVRVWFNSAGRPASCRNAVKDRPRARSVNLPPRSLGHNAGERSAVPNRFRPSAHQYCKSSTAQANSGEVALFVGVGRSPWFLWSTGQSVRRSCRSRGRVDWARSRSGPT
jgi:hypothetical protein